MFAGDSTKPLAAKLGLRPGMRVSLIRPPAHYRKLLGPLPEDVVETGLTDGLLDFIHVFAASRAELARSLPHIKRALAPDGMAWMSWPKAASKVSTDLNERVVRELGLQCGLVDVKVCAVDGTWSGLKFVYCISDRPGSG